MRTLGLVPLIYGSQGCTPVTPAPVKGPSTGQGEGWEFLLFQVIRGQCPTLHVTSSLWKPHLRASPSTRPPAGATMGAPGLGRIHGRGQGLSSGTGWQLAH